MEGEIIVVYPTSHNNSFEELSIQACEDSYFLIEWSISLTQAHTRTHWIGSFNEFVV